MKQLLLILFYSFSTAIVLGQVNVGINETTPSAMLDIKGTGTSSSASALQVKNSSSSVLFKVRNDGNVGVGFSNPAFRLDVQGRMRVRSNLGDAVNTPGIWFDNYVDNVNTAFIGMKDSIRVGFFGARGAGWQWNYDTKTGNVGMGMNPVINANLAINDPTGSSVQLFHNSSFQGGIGTTDSTFTIYAKSDPNLFNPNPSDIVFWPTLDPSCNLCFLTVPGNIGFYVNKPKANLHIGGTVLIGTANSTPAAGYKLNIDGKAICTEVKVQSSAAWPDYVFEKSYQMLTLDKLEKIVMQQKHLPNIPSAANVANDNGIELGKMQTQLLEKIEELYRYIFILNNKNKELNAKLSKLEKSIKN
jgi:hypothetical protein